MARWAPLGGWRLGRRLTGASAGADVVDWLYAHVEGFKERREARKYASGMLKRGFLRHTVNKVTFSEQCYYVFGDLSGGCESCECPSITPDFARRAAGALSGMCPALAR